MGNKEFGLSLQKFLEKTKINADTVVRNVVFDLQQDVMKRTPVKTGLARANWQIGIDAEPTGTIPLGGGNSASQAIANIKAGGIVYITNNLPYILALEEGHSKQAPNGMASLAVQKFQGIVDARAKELR